MGLLIEDMLAVLNTWEKRGRLIPGASSNSICPSEPQQHHLRLVHDGQRTTDKIVAATRLAA
jgi:hypothetical protein